MTVKQASVAVAALIGLSLVPTARGQFTLTNLSPAESFYSEARATFGSQQAGSVITETSSNASIWSGTAQSWISLSPAGSEASAIFGAAGSQQVGTVSFAGLNRASTWTGTAASWVDLNPLGSAESYGFATNGTQQVGYADVGSKRRASLWSGTADSWIDLNPLGSIDSGVFGMHENMQVGYAFIDNQFRASLWLGTAESWVDLNAFLPEYFTFSQAYSISSDGSTISIVGSGFNGLTGKNEALLWTQPIPAPAAGPLLALTGLIAARRRG